MFAKQDVNHISDWAIAQNFELPQSMYMPVMLCVCINKIYMWEE